MALKSKSVVKIEKGISFGKKSGAVMEVTKSAIEPDSLSVSQTSTNKWAIWGADNDYPQQIVNANVGDPTSAPALNFKIKAHYGLGPHLYKKRIEGDKEIIIPQPWELYPEIDDFRYENDLEDTCQELITDFEWFNQVYTQLIPNKAKTKIIQIKRQPTVNLRVGKRDIKDGQIKEVYISGEWPQPSPSDVVGLPVFNKKAPFQYPNAVYIHKQPSVDKIYYPTPAWYSNMKWLEISKKIPSWILSNMENSINLKYHVKIPQEYFLKLYPRENYDSDVAWEEALIEAEEKIKEQMDSFLAGEKNAMKTFYSKFAIDENGDPLPGWEIKKVENDLKDEAWLKADSTAAARIASAHSVPPDLVGLILSGNSGAGSGSNVREQFNHYVQMHTVMPRQTTLEWWEIVRRVNGWPRDLHLGYRNIILQTVDNAKGGFQREGEANSTTSNKN